MSVTPPYNCPRDCPRREMTCHVTCKPYLEAKDKRAAELRAIRRKRQTNSDLIELGKRREEKRGKYWGR